jgi:hypothetical protein
LNTDIAGFERWKCGGSGGRNCHGRNLGQWVGDTWASCPGSPGGITSRSGCTNFTKKGWLVRLTNGSDTAELLNGDLTFPATHPTFASQPIFFGHDSAVGGATCIASGSGTRFTCSTTPATTAYTNGMLIMIRLPVRAGNPGRTASEPSN